ncbi:Adenosylcobinamide amidohydrolase [compost metagenome]
MYLLLRSNRVLRTLNSSPWGGGFGWHDGLVNRQVNKNYNAADPLAEMKKFLIHEGLCPGSTASMLTAAWVSDVGTHSLQWADDAGAESNLQVTSWVTVGLGNRARAGHEVLAASLYPGTINSIVVVEGVLTDAAMVNAVITATEAKVAALEDLGVRLGDAQSRRITGTTTDAVLIAATQRGNSYQYAGTATQLGYLIGRTVYESVMSSGRLNLMKSY